MIATENDSDALRLAVKPELETLISEKFIADRSMSVEATAFTKIVDDIITMTPQCSQNF